MKLNLSSKFKEPEEIGIKNGGWCGEKYAETPDKRFVLFIPEAYSGMATVAICNDKACDDDSVISFDFDEEKEQDAIKLANVLAEISVEYMGEGKHS